jgi:hypothetical protein
MARRVAQSEIPLEEVNENEGLVAVTKDDAVLFVHPTCLEDHIAHDWLPVV